MRLKQSREILVNKTICSKPTYSYDTQGDHKNACHAQELIFHGHKDNNFFIFSTWRLWFNQLKFTIERKEGKNNLQ